MSAPGGQGHREEALYTETYVRRLRDERDDARAEIERLRGMNEHPDGYNEAGAEWLEPWCDEHPDLDGQGCVACIGASHDAWMHRAKAAEAEVDRLRSALEWIFTVAATEAQYKQVAREALSGPAPNEDRG